MRAPQKRAIALRQGCDQGSQTRSRRPRLALRRHRSAPGPQSTHASSQQGRGGHRQADDDFLLCPSDEVVATTVAIAHVCKLLRPCEVDPTAPACSNERSHVSVTVEETVDELASKGSSRPDQLSPLL